MCGGGIHRFNVVNRDQFRTSNLRSYSDLMDRYWTSSIDVWFDVLGACGSSAAVADSADNSRKPASLGRARQPHRGSRASAPPECRNGSLSGHPLNGSCSPMLRTSMQDDSLRITAPRGTIGFALRGQPSLKSCAAACATRVPADDLQALGDGRMATSKEVKTYQAR